MTQLLYKIEKGKDIQNKRQQNRSVGSKLKGGRARLIEILGKQKKS